MQEGNKPFNVRENGNSNSFLRFIEEFSFSNNMWILIIMAYAFSVVCRLYWVQWAGEYPEFFWNGELMINTNDGYAFAEGARDMVAGFHQPNDLSYFNSSLSTLTYWLASVLPIKFETIILYMSPFFSSLVVIAIMLISYEFKRVRTGFIAALLGSITNSYYNRTMAGYYDTDMLIITLSMFVLWSMIRLSLKNDKNMLFAIPVFILIYAWWYPSSFALSAATIGFFAIYTLIWQRKNLINYQAIVLMSVALTNMNSFTIQFGIILAIFIAFKYGKRWWNFKSVLALFAIVATVFIVRGGLNPIIFNLKFYVFRGFNDSSGLGTVFHYFNVNQTIQESGRISTQIFMERISGSMVAFCVSIAGYLLLCYKHRVFLLSLPMLALGFLAVKGGLRFTIYAVPIMALGFGWAVVGFTQYFKIGRAYERLAIVFMAAAALWQPLSHIYEYKTPTVFYSSEVGVLDNLKKRVTREDYVIAWWDYGYPIRYYSDVKTLIDGGKHLGADNFPVSFALFKDQVSSANMSRLEVEYTERGYIEKKPLHISEMMKDYGKKEINDFLLSLLDRNLTLPKKTRDIYYYLPDRMLNIFPVIVDFANLDLNDGKSYESPFFYSSYVIAQDENGANLGNGLILSNDATHIRFGSKNSAVNTFYETSYDASGKLAVKEIKFDPNSRLNVIFMKDYGRFIILDNQMLNSTYIQLFVLENYDKTLFEPTILTPAAKVYRLKR